MAGRIPDQFIDDLMQRVDIVDVVGARVPLKKAGKEYKACCPFHNEKTPSFTVSQEKQFYHCFGCGAHGTAISFLMSFEHLDFREAVEELAGRVGLEVPEEAGTGGASPALAGLVEVLGDADRFFRQQLRTHPAARHAVEYLKGRGLTGETARDFGLGFAPPERDALLVALGTSSARRTALLEAGLVARRGEQSYDRFRDRIMFPIHDHRGRIVGFGGRAMGNAEPKYLNSPETPVFHKGRELYGLYRARDAIRKAGRALVVEGYMDVVMLGQYGVDWAVATLGTATTRPHLERVFRYAPSVVFCFDGDNAGRRAAWRALEAALEVMHDGRQASFLFLPEGEDPDSLVRQEGGTAFAARVDRAVPLPDFLFDSLVQKVDMTREDGRAALAEHARPLLARLPEGVFKVLMLQRLADLTRTDPSALSTLVAKPDRPRARRSTAGRPQRPTLVQQTIEMLLAEPGLAQQAIQANLEGLRDPDAGLLRDLVGLLAGGQDWTTGAVLEHFRDTDHEAVLESLAVRRHNIERSDLITVFSECLGRLEAGAIRDRIEELVELDQAGKLGPDGKSRLRSLHQQLRQLQGRG